jgi:type I restriction enzyme M protein
MGSLIDRTHRELSSDGPEGEIAEIARTYHAWGGEKKDGDYEDKPGFCKSATLDDIKSHHYVLTPGRYVGAEATFQESCPGTL